MRILILKDERIDDVSNVTKTVGDLYRKKGVDITFHEEERDFSGLGWDVYNLNANKEEGPDYGINKAYIRDEAKVIKSRWGYEIDNVVFLVHDDSWNDSGDGIWGWNLANAFKAYEIEQVRWDPENEANTIGTLYHELAHSHDSYIYRNLGIWIEGIVGINDWDADLVHGGHHNYEYIQYQENADVLKTIAPYLNQSTEERKKRQMKEHISMLKRIRDLTKRVIELKREVSISIKKNDQT